MPGQKTTARPYIPAHTCVNGGHLLRKLDRLRTRRHATQLSAECICKHANMPQTHRDCTVVPNNGQGGIPSEKQNDEMKHLKVANASLKG